ncbi:DUF262 domain-containing protein [Microvirga sp. 2TAF3]|uniref:DUF262 domain-containing protein n=1 Tax=Microvirga sp. 2TAF3 TaxID=3233014 RepID=UPI003F96B7D2
MNDVSPSESSELDAVVTEDVLGVEAELVDNTLLIDKPFDPSKIKVTTEKKNIDLVVRRIDHGEVDLAPEFQRRARVWHPHRKSQLIESLLLRIPLPVFYVSANPKDDWAVVDGLQRITTIYDFMKGEFSLAGLEYLGVLEGRKFADLDRAMQRRIEETELVINVIQPGTPEEVMINIFKRINTGGTPLTGQEIRNALNKGPVRKYLRDLAEDPTFKSATDSSVRDDRMDAQEMVLRFLAFRMTKPSDYRVNDLDTFLNEAMRKINAMTEEERTRLASEFFRAMRTAHSIFGTVAFRKPRMGGNGQVRTGRNPVSKPLFEAWSVALAGLGDDQVTIAINRRDEIIAEFQTLLAQDPEFVISVSYSTGVPTRVTKRFGSIEFLLQKVLLLDQ